LSLNISEPQITVLDAGGQYCHLIARKVRELGVYADVVSSETPATQLAGRRGLIISGGPASVYQAGSPVVDPALYRLDAAVLGICYGHQLMAHQLGGTVRRGEEGEYGLAVLTRAAEDPLFEGVGEQEQVWMSHRDTVVRPPEGFRVLALTATCEVAAMGDVRRRLYGLQFHPEVAHTRPGMKILANFLFRICGCRRDWNPRLRVPLLEEQIREAARDRKVFFFVSGGVDSTVAFTLTLRALGRERVRGIYVDTGLMREGETEFVEGIFSRTPEVLRIERAGGRFLAALKGVADPEQKRRIIGEEFVSLQERILESQHFLDGDWILGQGTIYPDTIESGGTAKAAVIKTHHNRVSGILRLLEAGRVVEPLTCFYKDEVREVGRELGLPEELLDRHPFPGPGLAIRCLCSEREAPVRRQGQNWLLPLRSVGVQGDARSYAPVVALARGALEGEDLHGEATRLINRDPSVNRVVAMVAAHAGIAELRARPALISDERLQRLRRADALVRRLSVETGYERCVWQFPVILAPLGTADRPDSVVLRPVESVDGMTASSAAMPRELLARMSSELLEVEGIAAVFYDLTHKPPATIEWE